MYAWQFGKRSTPRPAAPRRPGGPGQGSVRAGSDPLAKAVEAARITLAEESVARLEQPYLAHRVLGQH